MPTQPATELFWSQVLQVAIIADFIVTAVMALLSGIAPKREWRDYPKQIALLGLLTLVGLMFGYAIVGR